jgi:hypothetical protein
MALTPLPLLQALLRRATPREREVIQRALDAGVFGWRDRGAAGDERSPEQAMWDTAKSALLAILGRAVRAGLWADGDDGTGHRKFFDIVIFKNHEECIEWRVKREVTTTHVPVAFERLVDLNVPETANHPRVYWGAIRLWLGPESATPAPKPSAEGEPGIRYFDVGRSRLVPDHADGPRNKGGRPGHPLQKAFQQEVVRFALTADGFQSRTELKQHMAEWLRNCPPSDEPDERTVRRWIDDLCPPEIPE